MRIAFVHNNKAFLSETEAYRGFFARYGIDCVLVSKEEIKKMPCDVEWRLMGTDLSPRRRGVLKIHEYTSTSIPPWRKWKNLGKKWLNVEPDYRLFLNEYVKNSFGFDDDVEYGYRDMGIPDSWMQFASQPSTNEFDFVYLGDLSPVREPEKLLNCFASGHLREQSLLVIGKEYEALKNRYNSFQNIQFIGPLPYEQIPQQLKRARFGINFMMDKEPLNRQTSTKFLEYAAVGLPVVSTQYHWIMQFEQQYGGQYCYVRQDLSDLHWERVCGTIYASPDLKSWTWEQQIRQSGVLDCIEDHWGGTFDEGLQF